MPYYDDNYYNPYRDMYDGWYKSDGYNKYESLNKYIKDTYIRYHDRLESSFPESVIRKYGDDFSSICQNLSRNDLLKFISFCNENNIKIDGNSNYLIRWSALYGKWDVLKLVLDNPTADPTADNDYAIKKCIEYNKNDFVVRMLNDKRVDICSNYNTIFLCSLKYKNNDIINYILNHPNFDINIGIEDIIKISSDVGNIEVLKRALVYDKLSLKRSISIGFISACKHNQIEIIDMLMKSENIDISYDNNNSFLHCFSNQKYDLCKKIIDDDRFDPSKGDYLVVEGIIRYKNYDILQKVLNHKNILIGNVNVLIIKMLSYPDYLKRFIVDNQVIGLINDNVKNELIKNKLIPFYKGKQIERTL